MELSQASPRYLGYERRCIVDARKLIRQWMADAEVNAEQLRFKGGPSMPYFYAVMRGSPITLGFIARVARGLGLDKERQAQLVRAAKLPVPWDLVAEAAELVGVGDHPKPRGVALRRGQNRAGAEEPSLAGVR